MKNKAQHLTAFELLEIETTRSTSRTGTTTDPDFETLFTHTREVSSILEYDSLFVYHLPSNSAASFITMGGQWVDQPKIMTGAAFFAQQMRNVPKEFHNHFALLMAAMLKALRFGHFPKEDQKFKFDFMVQRQTPLGRLAVASRVKIVKCDKLDRPVMIMFQQRVCHFLSDIEKDDKLFRLYVTSLELDYHYVPSLRKSLKQLLSPAEYIYLINSMNEMGYSSAKKRDALPLSPDSCNDSQKNRQRSYALGTRIAEKTTDHDFPTIKAAYSYLTQYG